MAGRDPSMVSSSSTCPWSASGAAATTAALSSLTGTVFGGTGKVGVVGVADGGLDLPWIERRVSERLIVP